MSYFLTILKHKLALLLAVIGFLIFLAHATFAQDQWLLSYPSESRDGHFYIRSPKNSTQFYLFGSQVKAIDTTNQNLVDITNLPNEILYKEAVTGYSAPYRHMNVFTYNNEKWWIVFEGKIFSTENAGKNWEEVLSLSPNTQYLSSAYFTDIHFPSENVGYAVGTADKIFRTLDGGKTWEELQWSNSTTPYRRLNNVHFINESVGFAMGYEVDDILLNIGVFKPLYYFTTDAGQTWEIATFPESDHHYVDIDIVWEETWYLSLRNRNFIAPADKLYKSTNGGKNWDEVMLPRSTEISSMVIRGMHWFTPDEGVILGSTEFFGLPNHIFKTTDGGVTWQKIALDAGSDPFFGKIPNIAMKFNGNQGIITGATGNILYSTDKGDTWQSIQKGLPDVYDMSSDDGTTYAALYGDKLLKHNWKGWSELNAPLNSQFQKAAPTKVSNLGKQEVAVVDIYGELHYSKDGGNSWQSLFSSTDTTVLDVAFMNDKLITVMYTDNQLLYSPDTNNQQNIELIIDTSSRPASVFEIFHVNNTIYIKVETLLFRKVEGTWESVTVEGADIRSILMDNSGNALIRSASSEYLYSNDTTQTWRTATFSNEILSRINFEISSITGFGQLNDTTHYALVHGSSTIAERFETSLILSIDKGKNWQLADFAFFSEPNELGRISHAVDNQENLWMGTANGAIYQWLLKETVTGSEKPIKYDFSVYPNPTTGKFKVIAFTEVEAYQLYDLQGRIIDSGYSKNNNEFVIPHQQPAGIYILQLVTTKGARNSVKIFKK